MTSAVIQGNERGTYSRARTSYVNGTRDTLQGETPMVTESS